MKIDLVVITTIHALNEFAKTYIYTCQHLYTECHKEVYIDFLPFFRIIERIEKKYRILSRFIFL